jgi:hypothetical protein
MRLPWAAGAIDFTLRPEITKFVGFQDPDALDVRPEAPAVPGFDPDPRGFPIKPPPAASKPIKEGMLKLYTCDVAPTGRRARAQFDESKMERTLTVRPGESALLELDSPPISEAAKRRIFVLATVRIVKPERGPAGVEIKAADATDKE